MNAVSQLATSMGRHDEEPNKAFAVRLSQTGDKATILELIDTLKNKDKNLQSDAIKVLYELGLIRPGLISPHTQVFVRLLSGKNNRLTWGAMEALHAIARAEPADIYAVLPYILDAAERGSVITRDHAVGILAILGTRPEYADEAVPLLIDNLKAAPVNQLPAYAEKTAEVMKPEFRAEFARVLRQRLPELQDYPAKVKRVEKVLKKMG